VTPGLALLLVTVTAAPDVSVTLLDGSSHHGVLKQLDSMGIVTTTSDGKQNSAVIDELLRVDFPGEDRSETQELAKVWLNDGSCIPLVGFELMEGRIELKLSSATTLSVPSNVLRSLRWYGQRRLSLKSIRDVNQQWNEILSSQHTADTVVLRKLNRQSKQQQITLDYVEAEIIKVTDKEVEFLFDGERVTLDRKSKIEGLIFYQSSELQPPDSLVIVQGEHGLQIVAREIKLAAGDQIEILTLSGFRFELSLRDISRIDYSSGKIVYLSDLEPETSQVVPFVNTEISKILSHLVRQPRRDTSFDGHSLSLSDGAEILKFTKGLAIHSRTKLIYRLRGAYHQFHAVVGMDPDRRGRGHVVLEISGDDRVLFREVVQGGREPVPLELDVSGVRRLQILVDYGEGGDVADHLHLCDARVSK